jgi:uncharacterized protein YrrD
MNNKISIWWLLVLFIIFFAALKQCEGKPKVVTKTTTKVKTIHDTITEVKIDTIYTQVYIEKTKTIKGKDSIIYKDKPSETTTTANQYQTTLKSNKATAKLDITTTGELLDVSGTITYPEKETITRITKVKPQSGLFIYGSAPISSRSLSPEVGALFQIKNKLILGAGVQYDNITNNVNATFTLGVKIW